MLLHPPLFWVKQNMPQVDLFGEEKILYYCIHCNYIGYDFIPVQREGGGRLELCPKCEWVVYTDKEVEKHFLRSNLYPKLVEKYKRVHRLREEKEQTGREWGQHSLFWVSKMEEVSQIIVERRLTNISECDLCGGVVFSFSVKSINFDEITERDRTRMRAMVIEGESELEQLRNPYCDRGADVVFYIDEGTYSICEKCGHESSYPSKGGR